MPTKSNNMSPMPMQPKIGEASLKFGPDWLRALSSSDSPGGVGGNSGGDGVSVGGSIGGGHRGGGGGWGEGPRGFYNFSNNAHTATKDNPNLPQKPTKLKEFKQSEYRYSREEILALYDKNLLAPNYLLNLGTLYVEKMQPPLAFSQPSEDEIRIWHSPQPESSRQGAGGGGGGGSGVGSGGSGPITPISRGYNIRGRGSGVERGRGRGRAIYGYGRGAGGGLHEEEDRDRAERGFSRPRNFERSQSNHERGGWGERNGGGGAVSLGVGGAPAGFEEGGGSGRGIGGGGGGGSWRNRDSFGSGGRKSHEQEGNEDGWRKPRWRRGDEENEDYQNQRNNSRRLHRSWSEDESQDNLPEWARDNPSEESGTFDASGAFHGEKKRERESSGGGGALPPPPPSSGDEGSCGRDVKRVNNEPESSPGGSHSNNDRVQKRVQERPEAVIPEEGEPEREREHQHHHRERDRPYTNSINATTEPSPCPPTHPNIELSERERRDGGGVGGQSGSGGDRASGSIPSHQPQHHQQQQHHHQHHIQEPKIGKTIPKNMEDDRYRSMTEEAMNLVTKLIEEDAAASRSRAAAAAASAAAVVLSHNEIAPVSSSLPLPHPPSPSSLDVWYYRDPQGSVQGPFNTHEMALWCSQGYFTGSLLLRRECDKIFITLLEMGKLYGRNPFVPQENPSAPPPIQEPNSALIDSFPRGEAAGSQIQAHAQLRQQQQQQLIQQSILREQYMINMSHGVRKEELGPVPQQQQPITIPPQSQWQQGQQGGSGPPPLAQQRPGVVGVGVPGGGGGPSAEQIQAQLLMSVAKSQLVGGEGGGGNSIEHLHALFHRQLKTGGGGVDIMQNKPPFSDLTSSRPIPTMEMPLKSPSSSSIPVPNPIHSLVQQLTNMANANANTHHHKKGPGPEGNSPWGQQQQQNIQQQNHQWGTTQPSANTPWEYREQMAKLQQEEELRRLKEEEENERKRLEEEERKRMEDQQRIDRERKKMEEAQRTEEERQRKLREEQYLMQKQQEAIRKQQEEAEILRQKEVQRQLLEQQRQLRDEQTRLAEEHQQMEQKRLEMERLEREQAAEASIRLERERQEHLKMQQFSWNPQQPNNPSPNVGGKSLIEIQQEESIKQEKEASVKKKQMQEQLKLQQQQQQQQAQQQKAINLKWAQSAAAPLAKEPIKSFTEIQAEEQAKLQKQQEQDREKRAIIHNQTQQQAAWSAQLTWANRASALAASGGGGSSTPPGMSTSKKVNGGVWEESSMASKLSKSTNNSSRSTSSSLPTLPSLSNPNPTTLKKSKELTEDCFMKLFSLQEGDGRDAAAASTKSRSKSSGGGSGGRGHDEFTRWCFERIQAIASGSVDIPTFVSFLKEVESPYDVGDYVRSYLGDGKDAKEFSREFLERRSRWKNSRKGDAEDNLCRPASAVNPNSNEFQEVKAKGKKTKKGKMQKVDSRILGFSTSAAPDRLNRDFGDSTD